MSALPQLARPTWDEYHKQDEASPVKLEFIRGEIVAMAGSSPAHALITANITGSLHGRLKGRPCYPTSSDQRVKAETSDDGFYPDVTVICPSARYDNDGRTLLNPSVIFEVLSPSTAESDLTSKSDAYFQIPSLTMLVFVSQDRVRVEVRTRGENTWQFTVSHHLSDEIALPAIGATLPVAEIYERLNLPEMRLIERNGSSA